MKTYDVRWNIDIFDAETPEGAAMEAWRMMRGAGSIATCFTVEGQEIDIEHERPEDLADLAPGMADLLRECLPYVGIDTEREIREMLLRVERVA